MDTLYYDKKETPWIGHPCEVQIDGELITVSYTSDDEKITYTGYAQSPGIYLLKGTDDCSATLYGFEKSKIMYGGWSYEAHRGLWKITLGQVD
ncbi:hypothetical protein CEW81_14590 [Kluyvera genomosp. 3]|uniref:Uncharacterized protein n=1 Tax=Kluyvera genomosp. 3 TaxID=2774055 RepID=A0A248KJP4_9ENTR|nr:hypothetical protein CEW81_14590 [Kluyvera genomosp. 3]